MNLYRILTVQELKVVKDISGILHMIKRSSKILLAWGWGITDHSIRGIVGLSAIVLIQSPKTQFPVSRSGRGRRESPAPRGG